MLSIIPKNAVFAVIASNEKERELYNAYARAIKLTNSSKKLASLSDKNLNCVIAIDYKDDLDFSCLVMEFKGLTEDDILLDVKDLEHLKKIKIRELKKSLIVANNESLMVNNILINNTKDSIEIIRNKLFSIEYIEYDDMYWVDSKNDIVGFGNKPTYKGWLELAIIEYTMRENKLYRQYWNKKKEIEALDDFVKLQQRDYIVI